MYTLRRLCEAVRAISPHASIKFTGKPDPLTGNGDLWKGTIAVGDAIIAEHTGTLDEVTDALTQRLSRLTHAVLTRLGREGDEPFLANTGTHAPAVNDERPSSPAPEPEDDPDD